MNSPTPFHIAVIKVIACLLVVIGLGWTFAEVRRLVLNTGDFCAEADDDRKEGRTISLVCGAIFLLVGSVVAYFVFSRQELGLTFQYPYVLGEGSEVHSFFIWFCAVTAGWAIFSAASTHFLPPPLFGEATTQFLCRVVRGSLFALWLAGLVYALPHIGDKKAADIAGGVLTVVALGEIWSGQIWSYRACEYWWGVPPITCEARPFPYVASNLFSIALGFFFLIA